MRRSITPALTADEIRDLDAHELTISQGLDAFLAVGNALLDIRQRKLYRAEHATFTDYFRAKWDLSKSHAYRLMQAARIVAETSPIGEEVLDNEYKARALVEVPSDLRKEVLERVKSQNEPVTEQSVTRAVIALLDEKRSEQREQAGQEDEEEGEDDERPAPETRQEQAARQAARQNDKPRLYLERGLEYLRLAVKNLKKVQPCDLKTKKARREAQEGLDAAEDTCNDVQILIREAE